VNEPAGGRIFFANRGRFSSSGRALSAEDQIPVITVGIDVGSSTSHLVFSRITMERWDSRYIVAEREALYESSILLTPYAGENTIDAGVLSEFIAIQHHAAGLDPERIDAGALILTGVAAERSNARRIGELFAREAGKMVAVSAGDGLEAVMAAHGSGAVARSLRENATVMNIDIGGGTSKIAICAGGKVSARTALDAGSRLVSLDHDGRIVRVEGAARLYADELGIRLAVGEILGPKDARALAELMADRLMEALGGGLPTAGGAALLRLGPLPAVRVDCVTLSGGVAEYFYERERAAFGDLGSALASAIRARLERSAARIEQPSHGIRATAIGASQYTTQVSGTTIYVSPLEVLPLRNVPVVTPELQLDIDIIDPSQIRAAIEDALAVRELNAGETPVAIFFSWRGSATFARIDAFCRGVAYAQASLLRQGHPLVLVNDGDVGGLIGIHFHQELPSEYPVVSIDGLELREFDFIDVGRMLDLSGAVPVVIKSLVFPAGRERLYSRVNLCL
jgi:ethanolamine utilization protein EutA